MKNNLLKLLGIKSTAPSKFIQDSINNSKYAWVGGYPVYNYGDTIQNIDKGYVGSEDVYSIVKRIATTASMIPLKVYEIKDDKALLKYLFALREKTYSTQTLLRKQFLKNKALEEVSGQNDLQNLLDNPNPTYTAAEFYQGAYSFRLLTGNTYIHIPTIAEGKNAGGVIEMWLAPSQWMSLQVSNTWPRIIIGYRLQMAELIPLAPDEIIHVRYFNPQFNYVGNELIGLSPLRAGARILARQEAETDYSVNAFQNSGISGIVWNKSIKSDEVSQTTLDTLKNKFYTEGTGTDNARKLLFSAGELGYTQIGLGPVDMGILQSEVKTFKKLCNLYSISDRLFNNDATGSEISVDIAYKDLYTNAALPEVYALRDGFNKDLTPKFNKGKSKFFIDADITGITQLQDDILDMAQVYNNLPAFNPKIMAAAFNMDSDDIPDKWFIKQGYQTVEDALAGSIEPLPIETDDGN